MVSKGVISPIYPIYKQVITHLLTSWDIQVEMCHMCGDGGKVGFMLGYTRWSRLSRSLSME